MPLTTHAQWPVSEVFLCQVKWNQKNVLVDNPKLLSGFNKNGYNNQPFFISYQEIFLTVNTDSFYTDIYQLNLDKKEFFQTTKTEKISEFSANLIPSQNHFSVVRIEKDGKTQTLWQYPMDRSNYGKNLFPALTNIGYHAWINTDEVAMFLVDSTFSLVIGHIKTGNIRKISQQTGRCLKSKNGFLYFSEKEISGLHRIKKYDPLEQTIVSITLLPEKTEDFEVLVNGNILFADKSKIIMIAPERPDNQQILMDLAPYGIQHIKRIASERDRIILVNQP